MNHEHIINSLIDARKKKKMTQEELAQCTEVSRQTIISIEKGNYTPSVLLAIKIAQTLSMNVEDIFTLKKP